ncbi:hypothetical protein Tco_0672515 [Tanacetum coccineum]
MEITVVTLVEEQMSPWKVLRARRVAMKGGRCFGGHGYNVVTKRCLEALVLKGGDGGAFKLLRRLLGDVIEVLEVLGC